MIQAVYQFFYYLTCAQISILFVIRYYSLALQSLASRVLHYPGFFSNLTDRQYYISLHNSKSPTVSLKQGVPQGSVLRLLRFILYIQPLGQIMHHHGFNHHSSADDIQYILLVNQILTHSMASLSSCVSELKDWLYSNFLSLNLSKTETLITGPPSRIKNKTDFSSFDLDATSKFPSATVRNVHCKKWCWLNLYLLIFFYSVDIILDPSLTLMTASANSPKRLFSATSNCAT